MSPNTENIEARLTAYIDGELDAQAKREIEKHLAENPQHRALIADLMAQRDLLRGLPVESAPADLREAIEQQIERSMLLGGPDDASHVVLKIRRWPQVFAVAAILLLTVGLGVVVYQVVTPPEPHMQLTMVAPATAPVPLVTDAPDPAASEAALAKSYGANAAPRASLPMRDLKIDGPAIALPTPGELLDARNRPAEVVAESTTLPTDPTALAAAPVAELGATAQTAPASAGAAAPAAMASVPSDASDSMVAAKPLLEIAKADATDKAWVNGVLNRAGFVDRAKSEPLVVVLNSADPASVDQRVRDVLSSSNLQWDGPREEPPAQKADVSTAKVEVPEENEKGRFARSKDAEDQQSILLRQNNRSQVPYTLNDSAPRAPMVNSLESNAGVRQEALSANRDDAVLQEQVKSVPSPGSSPSFAPSMDGQRVFYVRNLSTTQASELAGRLRKLDTPAAMALSQDVGERSPAGISKEVADKTSEPRAVGNEAKTMDGIPATRETEVDTDSKTVVAEPSSLAPTTSPAVGLAFTPTTEPTTVPTESTAVDLVIVVQSATPAPTTAPTTQSAATLPVTLP